MKTLRIAAASLLTLGFCQSPLLASNYSDNLATKVKALSGNGDLQGIRSLIDAEEAEYKSNPTASHYENMMAMAIQLGSDPKIPQYWISRRIVWELALDPLPKFNNSEEVRNVFKSKDTLLREALRSTYGPAKFQGHIDSNLRHEAAMLLISYANRLKQEIVLGCRNKATAPINAESEETPQLRQNDVDNVTQEDLDEALSSIRWDFAMDIMYAYSCPPRNEQEAKEIVDALGIGGRQGKEILALAAKAKP